jgi:hypothetical protein
MPNNCQAMFTKDWTYLNQFPLLWAISRSPTSSIQYSSTCLTTSRSRFCTT